MHLRMSINELVLCLDYIDEIIELKLLERDYWIEFKRKYWIEFVNTELLNLLSRDVNVLTLKSENK